MHRVTIRTEVEIGNVEHPHADRALAAFAVLAAAASAAVLFFL